MIELFEQDIKRMDRHSSKGNQLKWEKNGIWYKADYTGYEGLAEYVTAALLADTRLDYPLIEDVFELMDQVQGKTISVDFDEQLDAAEELYGCQLKFSFTQKNVDAILNNAYQYSEIERERVRKIIYQQMRKYKYLFI